MVRCPTKVFDVSNTIAAQQRRFSSIRAWRIHSRVKYRCWRVIPGTVIATCNCPNFVSQGPCSRSSHRAARVDYSKGDLPASTSSALRASSVADGGEKKRQPFTITVGVPRTSMSSARARPALIRGWLDGVAMHCENPAVSWFKPPNTGNTNCAAS